MKWGGNEEGCGFPYTACWDDHALAAMLGMSINLETHIVYPDWRDLDLTSISSVTDRYALLTRPVAVRMLDNLMATREVDWQKAYLDEQESKCGA